MEFGATFSNKTHPWLSFVQEAEGEKICFRDGVRPGGVRPGTNNSVGRAHSLDTVADICTKTKGDTIDLIRGEENGLRDSSGDTGGAKFGPSLLVLWCRVQVSWDGPRPKTTWYS